MDSAKQQNKLTMQEQLKGTLVILMAIKDIKLGSKQAHNVMHQPRVHVCHGSQCKRLSG